MHIYPFAGRDGCEREGVVAFHAVRHGLALLGVVARTNGALAVGEASGICRRKGDAAVYPEVCRGRYLPVYPLHLVVERRGPLACTVPGAQSNLRCDGANGLNVQPG